MMPPGCLMSGGSVMDLGLTGRSVAVLGAGSGLGRATALGFAAEGATVTVFGRRAEPLEAVAKEAARRGAASSKAS
jgi:NAD(P)-dependent dehydrogenase (short-subunit alcohol dehydrogenase family)